MTNWYILLAGLPRPDSVLHFGSGLSVRPLTPPLTVFDLAAAGAAGFREWAVLEPFVRICTCELETAGDAAERPGYDTLNRAWLVSALLVLRGFTRHLGIACSAYSWDIIAGHQARTSHIFREQLVEQGVDAAVYKSRRELAPFEGGVLDYHLKLLVDDNPRTDAVNEDDAVWIERHLDIANRLASESAPFRLALEAAIDWRYAKEPRTAIARLWSGIEAVFGINSELVYRISLLSASLLAARGDARKAKFEAVKRLYSFRSKAVHGEPLSPENLSSAMNGSYYLLRELLLLSLDKGHALQSGDFDAAVFW